MPHSTVKLLGLQVAKPIFAIATAGAVRAVIQSPGVVPRIDYSPLRTGRGYLADKVTINGVGVRRRVICFEASTGRFFSSVWSDLAGNYRFDNLDAVTAYLIVSIDHQNQYDPVGKAPLYPTRYV